MGGGGCSLSKYNPKSQEARRQLHVAAAGDGGEGASLGFNSHDSNSQGILRPPPLRSAALGGQRSPPPGPRCSLSARSLPSARPWTQPRLFLIQRSPTKLPKLPDSNLTSQDTQRSTFQLEPTGNGRVASPSSLRQESGGDRTSVPVRAQSSPDKVETT